MPPIFWGDQGSNKQQILLVIWREFPKIIVYEGWVDTIMTPVGNGRKFWGVMALKFSDFVGFFWVLGGSVKKISIYINTIYIYIYVLTIIINCWLLNGSWLVV